MRFRLERRYEGIGSVRKVVDLLDDQEFEEFKGLMAQLARTRPKLVGMFVEDKLTASGLLRASREERLGSLLPDERLVLPLAAAFAAVWEKVDRNQPGKARRYRTSAQKLLKLAPGLQTVQDLAGLDWEALAASWGGSPTDWMHLYRMLSRFLTLHLGGGRTGRLHPWRAQVMDLLPRKKEKKRVPDLPPAVFLRVVARTPEHLRPAYMTLAATGLRLGEFMKLQRAHLRPAAFEVEVPGTKTEDSAAVIPIDPALWRWVDLTVPCAVGEYGLRNAWKRACAAEGVQFDHLHDLRHCHGQWCINEGVPEAMVQASLRHSEASMTRRYTLQQMRAEPARAMARVLGAA